MVAVRAQVEEPEVSVGEQALRSMALALLFGLQGSERLRLLGSVYLGKPDDNGLCRTFAASTEGIAVADPDH